MRFVLSLIFLVSLSQYAYAHDSLFFTQKELSTLSPEKNSPSKPAITLNAISYLGEHNWTIWVNKDIIRPGVGHPLIEIVRVDPLRIYYRWKGKSDYQTLGVGQTSQP